MFSSQFPNFMSKTVAYPYLEPCDKVLIETVKTQKRFYDFKNTPKYA